MNADILLILTAISEVKIHYKQEDEKGIVKMTVDEAKGYIEDGEFAAGSMLPKIEACIYFLLHSKNTKAIIASLENAKEAIHGKSGTTIEKGGV
jgi:carbamate kinase